MTTIDWSALGTGLAIAFIAFMQSWQAYKTRQIAKTAEQIHILTNSAMGLQKQSLMRTTAALAAITHNPEDEKAALDARADFDDHQRKQVKVDAL